MRRVRVAVNVVIEMDVEDSVSTDNVHMMAEQVIEAMTEDSGRRDDGWVPDEDGMIEAMETISDVKLTHGWTVRCGVTGNQITGYGFKDDADFAASQCGPNTPHTFTSIEI